MKKYKKQDGITLIALVVTIIVLIILATVSINLVLGDGGIIKQAEMAAEAQANAEKKEQESLQSYLDYLSDKLIGEQNNNPIVSKQGTITLTEGINVDYSITQQNNVWASTISFQADIDETLTKEQKQNIAAFLLDFESYNAMKAAFATMASQAAGTEMTYEDYIAYMNYETEEDALDDIIELEKRFLKYDDLSELKDLGIEVIQIQNPYGTTMYLNNLGNVAKCSFNSNGNKSFTFTSGSIQKTEQFTIDNIRTAGTSPTHTVKVYRPYGSSYTGLEYSVDNGNTWNTVPTESEITCTDNIKFRFDDSSGDMMSLKEAGEGEGQTLAYSISYCTMNENYFAYFNEEDIAELPFIISPSLSHSYFCAYANLQGMTLRQYFLQQISATQNNYLTGIANYSYRKTFEIWPLFSGIGWNIENYSNVANTYPELQCLNYNATEWHASDEYTESPECTINVNSDMMLLVVVDSSD